MHTTRSRLPGEIAVTALLLEFSAFMLWPAYGISGFESLTSAASFPMVAASVMLVTGLIKVVHTARARQVPPQEGESLLPTISAPVDPTCSGSPWAASRWPIASC